MDQNQEAKATVLSRLLPIAALLMAYLVRPHCPLCDVVVVLFFLPFVRKIMYTTERKLDISMYTRLDI
jgi:hypothetical protein